MKNTTKMWLIFLLLFVNAIVMSCPSHAASIWDKRKGAVEKIKEAPEAAEEDAIGIEDLEETETFEGLPTEDILTDTLDPQDIYIPDQYGSIIETHKGTNGKLIIHVQDAHVNYEGQINSADILETLIEDYDLKLILMEGKLTDRDFKYLREDLPLEARKELADRMLKEGYLTGVNYLDLGSDYPIVIQGIEDKSIYDKGANALWEIDKFKELAAEYISKLITVSDAIKPKIYNEGLVALDSKKKEYDAETIDLLAYYEFLYNQAEENEIPLYTFPNFQNLIKASNIEKKIDLVKVRDGSASAEEMDMYNEYIEATRDLNVNELFKEEPLLEDVLQDTLAETYDQKKLVSISNALAIMKNLLRIKVVPEEYKYFTENKKDFDPKFWSNFLKEKSQELNLSLGIPENHFIISDNLPKIENFYGIAFERDRIFVKRTEEHLKNEGVDLAALVAGGFHTPTVTKLLADKGYSYIVVSPKVTTETDDELYRWALKRDWIPEIE